MEEAGCSVTGSAKAAMGACTVQVTPSGLNLSAVLFDIGPARAPAKTWVEPYCPVKWAARSSALAAAILG